MAQLLTDVIYENGGPMRIYYVFGVKLIAFMALTNCFKKFYGVHMFCLHLLYISCPITKSP